MENDQEVNFLMETVKFLSEMDRVPADIAWVGSADGEYAIPWSEFEPIAVTVYYDPEADYTPIADDLVIVFKDGSWLMRYEAQPDGWGDGWVLKASPKKKADARGFDRVCGYSVEAANWEAPE